MYANGTTDGGDKYRKIDGGADISRAVESDKGRVGGSHDASHALDHFHCPTLMEFVVDFLDRYNDRRSHAPCGQC